MKNVKGGITVCMPHYIEQTTTCVWRSDNFSKKCVECTRFQDKQFLWLAKKLRNS